MALRDRITNYQHVATATPATVATLKNKELRTVAKVATVAVADEEKGEIYSVTSPQARTWTAGNPYICSCGEITGWRLDGQALCPVCLQHGPNFVDDQPTPKELPQPTIKKKKFKPSSIALKWLLEHRQALDKAGWTRAELYRRNKSKRGIAWLDLWDKAFLLAYLHENGVIEFECSIHGRDYIQTARPASSLTRPNLNTR